MQALDCVFCGIGRGAIPCHRIWESEAALAFLDIGPLAKGHTLLIPKRHFQDIRDVSEDVLHAMLAESPKLADAVMRATGASGLNLLQNTGRSSGQEVPHIHFHLIPRIEGDGLGYRWNAGRYAENEAESVREQIAHELDR